MPSIGRSTLNTRSPLKLVNRQTLQCIRETEAMERRYRMKCCWQWMSNYRLIVAAFVITAGIVTANCLSLLLAGGNGIPFVGFVASMMACFSGVTQFFRCEPGYELQDWLPRSLIQKYGL